MFVHVQQLSNTSRVLNACHPPPQSLFNLTKAWHVVVGLLRKSNFVLFPCVIIGVPPEEITRNRLDTGSKVCIAISIDLYFIVVALVMMETLTLHHHCCMGLQRY